MLHRILCLFVVLLMGALQTSAAQSFALRTEEAGFGQNRISATNGVAVADYDRDGDLDVYFVAYAAYDPNDATTWNRLFRNRGDGTFLIESRTPELAGRGEAVAFSPMGYKLGAAWGDYNNDGWPDLFLTNLGPDQLFHNNGDGTFTEVTEAAGVAGTATHLSSSGLWFDYDRDGDLDLYVSIEEDYASTDRDLRNRLYQNQGDGTFTDVSAVSGTADAGKTWTTVSFDINNDGLLDLYLANDFGPNAIYLNNGDGTFQNVTGIQTGPGEIGDPGNGMGLAVADCDGNGFLDIYLTNITEAGPNWPQFNPLFLNTGAAAFINGATDTGTHQAGWGWGTEFFDADHDGDQDLFVVTGNFQPDFENVFFRNRSDEGTFIFDNIAAALGMNDLPAARGLALFDYDNDGDQDVLISNVSEPPVLYENTRTQGHWLKVKLEGTASNHDAFGTTVEVFAGGTSYKRYHHGAQFLGQNLVPVHVGLADAAEVERVVVTWPNGVVEEIGAVEVNQTLTLREGEGLVDGTPTATDHAPAVPEAVRLESSYPNPFRDRVHLRVETTTPGTLELHVFNALGQTARVVQQVTGAGLHTFTWDATDDAGQPLASGLYFYKVKLDGMWSSGETGRLVVVR